MIKIYTQTNHVLGPNNASLRLLTRGDSSTKIRINYRRGSPSNLKERRQYQRGSSVKIEGPSLKNEC